MKNMLKMAFWTKIAALLRWILGDFLQTQNSPKNGHFWANLFLTKIAIHFKKSSNRFTEIDL
jgi:fluoride ion exporter CrcB/FEX